jgi:hypothetical protein
MGKYADVLSKILGRSADDISEEAAEKMVKNVAPQMSQEAAPSLAATATKLQGSIGGALAPKSNLGNIAAGTAGVAGLGYGLSGNSTEEVPAAEAPIAQPQAPAAPQPNVEALAQNLKDTVTKATTPAAPVVPSAPIPVPAAPVQPQVEVAPAEDPYIAMMKEAQADQRQQNFIDNMLRAGITTGSAISRGSNKPDYSGVEALQKQNDQPVKGVQNLMDASMNSKKLKVAQGDLDDDTKLRDPNSDISTTLRGMLSKLGYPVSDKVSGKQLKDMGINVYNLIGQKEAREAARLGRESTQDNASANKARSAVDSGIRNLRNGSAYKAYSNTKNAMVSLEDAIATGDKVMAGTAFLRSAKVAQGDDSVVRSDDMKVLLGGTDYSPKAYMEKMQDLRAGKQVTDAELNAMQNIMKKVLTNEGKRVYQQASPHLRKIEENELDLASHFDPSEVEEFSKYGPGAENKETVAQYSPQEEQAIALVMNQNKGASRDAVIAALKKNGKIK